MEENSNQPVVNTSVSTSNSEIARPKGKKKAGIIVVLIILALLLIAGGIYFFFKSAGGEESEASPTPESYVIYNENEEEPTPAPTSSPVSKGSIKVQVLNGTGITGEATFLQTRLSSLGFTSVEVGNSSKQDYQNTLLTISSAVDETIKTELIAELEKIYTKVETKSGSSGSYDISVTTGLRKGVTPKPLVTGTPKSSSPTPTTSPSATKSPSPSTSPSPSATPKPSATPST